jgi:microcystin-dependent protein
MAQPYVGEIRMFAGNFAPAGWQFCAGQLLPISEYETLFNLIGTTYGGDGESTFALPDLQGRTPLHFGNGFVLAETGGVETVTLTVSQMPAHSHPMLAASAPATATNPQGNLPAQGVSKRFYGPMSIPGPMAPNSGTSTGGSQPHDNMQPYLCVSYIISLFGIFPSQT